MMLAWRLCFLLLMATEGVADAHDAGFDAL